MQMKYYLAAEEAQVAPNASVASLGPYFHRYGYVVVKEAEAFRGVLTPLDALLGEGRSAGECLRAKPGLNAEDDIETVVDLMEKQRHEVLPVFSKNGSYCGCVALIHLLRELVLLRKPSAPVSILNVVGAEGIESIKTSFVTELFHYTKNPIQAMFSSLDLLDSAQSENERKMLVETARNSAKRLNEVIDNLVAAYFAD